MQPPIEITVGGGGQYDPAAGATATPAIPALAGVLYYVEVGGYGTMPYADYTVNSNGGFSLTVGATFPSGQKYFAHAIGISGIATTGGYSNGYDMGRVIPALRGRLGFRQPTQAGALTLDSAILTARSGRCYDDFHSVVSSEIIRKTVADAALNASGLNTLLGYWRDAAIMQALNGVFNEPEYLESKTAYEVEGEQFAEVPNGGKFVGFEISVPKDTTKTVQLTAIYPYFNGSKTFTLYLYRKGRRGHVWSQQITVAAETPDEILLQDCYLPFAGACEYYLGYYQADLGAVKALRSNYDSAVDCNHFEADPFEAAATGNTAFDRANISEGVNLYGFNLKLRCFRDFTQFIVDAPRLFDELQGLCMAAKTVEQIIYALNSNAVERELKAQLETIGLQLDLNGQAGITDGPKITGLKDRITREAVRVKSSLFPKPETAVVDVNY